MLIIASREQLGILQTIFYCYTTGGKKGNEDFKKAFCCVVGHENADESSFDRMEAGLTRLKVGARRGYLKKNVMNYCSYS